MFTRFPSIIGRTVLAITVIASSILPASAQLYDYANKCASGEWWCRSAPYYAGYCPMTAPPNCGTWVPHCIGNAWRCDPPYRPAAYGWPYGSPYGAYSPYGTAAATPASGFAYAYAYAYGYGPSYGSMTYPGWSPGGYSW